jgi:PIN domain nuclease of toxin-antitoxin system
MKTLGISKFKSHALKILDQVAKTQEIIVATAREENATILTKDEKNLAYKNV